MNADLRKTAAGIFVDPTSPDYRRGERAANTLLDIGTGARAEELIQFAELCMSDALRAEDTSRYTKAKAFADTLYDFVADQGGC